MNTLRRFLCLALPVAVVLASLGLGYAQEAGSDKAKALLEQGLKQYKALSFKQAKQSFLKASEYRSSLSETDKKKARCASD